MSYTHSEKFNMDKLCKKPYKIFNKIGCTESNYYLIMLKINHYQKKNSKNKYIQEKIKKRKINIKIVKVLNISNSGKREKTKA